VSPSYSATIPCIGCGELLWVATDGEALGYCMICRGVASNYDMLCAYRPTTPDEVTLLARAWEEYYDQQ
jgi:hypothetical protein